MKLRTISVLSFAALSLFILSSSSGGRAAIFNEDRTGSPVAAGGSFCNNCHGGGNFGAAISAQLLDANSNPVTSYKPDSVYQLVVSMMGSAPEWGVQAVMLTNANTKGGDLSGTSANAKISPVSGRQYLEHNNPSTSGTFTVNWTAPPAGTGTISLYAAGVGTNNNGGSSGDEAKKLTPMLFIEDSNFSLEESSFISINTYPNPSSDFININVGSANLAFADVNLFNLQGQQVSSFLNQSVVSGSINKLDVSSLNEGMYILELVNDGETIASSRLLIQ